MSEEIKWQYLPAETDLENKIKQTEAEHYRITRVSVVEHWGIDSRLMKLKAILQDQKDNLHSMVEFGVCSCGLQMLDDVVSLPVALVTSRHHRNHITLEPEFPVFRGLVGRRLYSLGPEKGKIDAAWDLLILRYVNGKHDGFRFIPSTWTVHKDSVVDFSKKESLND
jgi:hypothetical protein